MKVIYNQMTCKFELLTNNFERIPLNGVELKYGTCTGKPYLRINIEIKDFEIKNLRGEDAIQEYIDNLKVAHL